MPQRTAKHSLSPEGGELQNREVEKANLAHMSQEAPISDCFILGTSDMQHSGYSFPDAAMHCLIHFSQQISRLSDDVL
jgi:hypothetical protein